MCCTRLLQEERLRRHLDAARWGWIRSLQMLAMLQDLLVEQIEMLLLAADLAGSAPQHVEGCALGELALQRDHFTT